MNCNYKNLKGAINLSILNSFHMVKIPGIFFLYCPFLTENHEAVTFSVDQILVIN